MQTKEQGELHLVQPSLDYRDDFVAMAQEYLHTGVSPENRDYADALRDPAAWIKRSLDQSRGLSLPPGQIVQTTFWLVRDNHRIVAIGRLRHELTPFLEYEGGHIGYSTRPSERRKGYGTILCRLLLEHARALGYRRVLITCDADNIGSTKIILKNGGKLENQVISRETGKLKNRYWVDLTFFI